MRICNLPMCFPGWSDASQGMPAEFGLGMKKFMTRRLFRGKDLCDPLAEGGCMLPSWE